MTETFTTGDAKLDARISALVPYILDKTITAYPALAPKESRPLSDKAKDAIEIINGEGSGEGFGCYKVRIAALVSVILGEDISSEINPVTKLKQEKWTVLVPTLIGVNLKAHNYPVGEPVLIDNLVDSTFHGMWRMNGTRGNSGGNQSDLYSLPTEQQVREILFANSKALEPLFSMIDLVKKIPQPDEA